MVEQVVATGRCLVFSGLASKQLELGPKQMSSLYTRDSRSKRLSSGGAFEPNPAAARPRRLHLLRRGRLPALLAAGWDAALRAVIVVNAPAGQSAAWAQVGMMGEAGQAPGGPGQGSRSTETKDRRRSCIKHALNVQNIETEHYSIMYKQVYSLDLISVLPDP